MSQPAGPEAVLAAWDALVAREGRPNAREMNRGPLESHCLALELHLITLDAIITGHYGLAYERADRAVLLWERLSNAPLGAPFDIAGLTADDFVSAAALLAITPAETKGEGMDTA